jgi:hypothetical protein
MFNGIMLGGISEKYAGAYLLPPTKRKKKKPQPDEVDPEVLDKVASAVVRNQQAIMQQQLAAGDLGGGWNPYDQV